MKYTKEERLEIGRQVYEGQFTRYQAAEKYGISDQTARDYMRMYRDTNSLPQQLLCVEKQAFTSVRKNNAVYTLQIALENLERLRLIEINKGSKYGNAEKYEDLKYSVKKVANAFVEDNKQNFSINDYQIVYDEFVILIRGFWQFFARACLGGDFSNIN